MPIVIKMEYEKFPPRYYQRRRNKRSSGSAEWHSRSPRLRALRAEGAGCVDPLGAAKPGSSTLHPQPATGESRVSRPVAQERGDRSGRTSATHCGTGRSVAGDVTAGETAIGIRALRARQRARQARLDAERRQLEHMAAEGNAWAIACLAAPEEE